MNYKLVFAVFLLIILGGIFFLDEKEIAGITGDVTDVQENFNVDRDTIIIPIKVHVVRDSSGYYTSFRDMKNILELFDQANRIWKQGNIYISIGEVVITEVSVSAIPNALNSNASELYYHENFDQNALNFFLTQSLNNINGIALYSINTALVSDYTTVNDYRTVAHELGHLLRLKHVPESDHLMARGRNGEKLTDWEIKIAREEALKLIEEFS